MFPARNPDLPRCSFALSESDKLSTCLIATRLCVSGFAIFLLNQLKNNCITSDQKSCKGACVGQSSDPKGHMYRTYSHGHTHPELFSPAWVHECFQVFLISHGNQSHGFVMQSISQNSRRWKWSLEIISASRHLTVLFNSLLIFKFSILHTIQAYEHFVPAPQLTCSRQMPWLNPSPALLLLTWDGTHCLLSAHSHPFLISAIRFSKQWFCFFPCCSFGSILVSPTHL